MPIPDFVPLIGSGFDQLANQQLQWANFSRGVEEANLAREAQAEQQQSNWLAQVSELNQRREEQNFQRQMDADAFGRQLTLSREAETTRQRERAQDIARATAQGKEQMAYGRNYLETQQKIAEEKIAAATKNHELTLESQGQHLAANYLITQRNHEAAQQALEDLHKQIDDTQSGLETERGKKKPDANKIIDLNNRLKMYNTQLRQRESDARKAENDFERLKNRADNANFNINEDGTITHPDTTKTWSWKNALRQAQTSTTPLGPPAPEPSPDLSSVLTQPNVLPSDMGGTPWAGFTQGTGTTPPPETTPAPEVGPANIPPVPVGAKPFKVGRYTVNPLQ